MYEVIVDMTFMLTFRVGHFVVMAEIRSGFF